MNQFQNDTRALETALMATGMVLWILAAWLA